MRKDLFACPGKISILGLVALVVSTSPERLHKGLFAYNNDRVIGLRVPAHEKIKHGRRYWTASLCMPVQIQAVLKYYTNILVSYKSPRKNQYWVNQLTKEMETIVKKKLEVCGVPKEKPRGAVTAPCKCPREEKLFKVNVGIRKKIKTFLQNNSGRRAKISHHQSVISCEVPELPRAVMEAGNPLVSFSLELPASGGHHRAGAGMLSQRSLR